MKNICFGYSLELPWQGNSNEYPQHMFLWRNKKKIFVWILGTWETLADVGKNLYFGIISGLCYNVSWILFGFSRAMLLISLPDL